MHNQVGTRGEISPIMVLGRYDVMRLLYIKHERSHDKRLQELY